MEKFKKDIFNKNNIVIFITVFAVGIFVHGSRFFNTVYFLDDLMLAYPGSTFSSGRWFLEYLFKFKKMVFGSHINTKGFIAIISFALIASIICIISNSLNLKNTKNLVLLSSVVITFPYIASLFGYSFTAEFYYFAMLMSVLSVYFLNTKLSRKNFWWILPISITLLGLSMAIYQSVICIYISFALLLIIKDTIKSDDETWKYFILRCIKYLSICISGLIFYITSNKIVLSILNIQLSSYQGLSSMTDVTISDILKRIFKAYKEFLYPGTGNFDSLYYTKAIKLCYLSTLFVLLVFFIVFIIKFLKKRNFKKCIQLLLLLIIIPIAINSPFIIADVETTRVHTLMLFSQVFVFVYLIFLLDSFTYQEISKTNFISKFKKVICIIVSVLLVYSSVYFSYLSNICYTKSSIQQQQAINYLNRVITQIQSLEDYSEEMPIVYLNEYDKDDSKLYLGEFNGLFEIIPYGSFSLVNGYNWQYFMSIWCGFSQPLADEATKEALLQSPEVEEMPCYPNSNSIQIINDIIVVKF